MRHKYHFRGDKLKDVIDAISRKKTINVKQVKPIMPINSDGDLKVVLVAIAKNEQPYIQEWVDYHKKIGFDHIYIYENDSRHTITGDRVTLIPWDNKEKSNYPKNSPQVTAYNNFISNYSFKFTHMAVWDIDEFIVLKQHKNIKDFIKAFSIYPRLAISWLFFGDNGYNNVVNNEYSVLKRFTKRMIGPHSGKSMVLKHKLPFDYHYHVKTIYKIEPGLRIKSPHRSFKLSRNIKGVLCQSNTFNPDYTFAQMNHYWCKTFEEFKNKVDRGRATMSAFRSYDEFERNNFNEVEDLLACEFMYGVNSHIKVENNIETQNSADSDS